MSRSRVQIVCGGGISSCALNRSTDIACIRCIQCVYHSTKNYAGGISGIWASARRGRCAKTCKNTPVRLGSVHPRPVYSDIELCVLYTALMCFAVVTGTEFAMRTAGQSNLQVCAHLQRSATDSNNSFRDGIVIGGRDSEHLASKRGTCGPSDKRK